MTTSGFGSFGLSDTTLAVLVVVAGLVLDVVCLFHARSAH